MQPYLGRKKSYCLSFITLFICAYVTLEVDKEFPYATFVDILVKLCPTPESAEEVCVGNTEVRETEQREAGGSG